MIIVPRPAPPEPEPVDDEPLSESLSVGLTESHKERIRRAADRAGLSMSAWARKRL